MSACPHTDNPDKCTCHPGCGCNPAPVPDHPTEQVDRVVQALVNADKPAWRDTLAWYRAMACAALDAATPDDRWGEGYRAGVIEGMYRAASNARDHARCTELGIPYEQGMPAVGSVGERDQ